MGGTGPDQRAIRRPPVSEQSTDRVWQMGLKSKRKQTDRFRILSSTREAVDPPTNSADPPDTRLGVPPRLAS